MSGGTASDEVIVKCRFEAKLPHDPMGKFETEDQRNWSDASSLRSRAAARFVAARS